MSIAFQATGTTDHGNGSNPVLNPGVPAGTGVGSLNLLVVAWKDTSIGTPTVSGTGAWILLGVSSNSTLVTSGTDVGSDSVGVWFTRDACPTAQVTFTGTVGEAEAAIVSYNRTSGTQVFELELATGEDGTIAANYSATAAVNMFAQPGDFLIAATGIRSHQGTNSASSITATGLTLGSTTDRVNFVDANGNDGRLIVSDCSVTSGTETAAPTYSFTNASTTIAGATAFVLIRLRNIAFHTSTFVSQANGANPGLSITFNSDSTADTRNYLIIGWKDSSIPEPTVSATTGSWTRMAKFKNTTQVATGTDSGSTAIVVYFADGPCPQGTIANFTGTVGDALGYVASYIKDTTLAYNDSWAFGEQDTFVNNFSATAYQQEGIAGGDLVSALCFEDSGLTGLTATTIALNTTGPTTGMSYARVNNNNTQGDHGRMILATQSVFSGTQSAPCTLAYTFAHNNRGVVFFLRTRAVAKPTLTVLPVTNFYQNVGYQCTISGLTPFSQYELLRQDNTGFPSTDVRGGQLQTIPGTGVVLDDYEFRFGSSDVESSLNTTTWYLNTYDGNGNLTSSVGVTRVPYSDWLSSVGSEQSNPQGSLANCFLGVPLNPGDNTPVIVNDFSQFQYKGNILSNSHVLGRQNPVVSIDVGTGRTGTLKLLVPQSSTFGGSSFGGSVGASSRLRDYTDILTEGQILLFRTLEPTMSGIDLLYFVVDAVTVNRTSKVVNLARIPMYIIEVSFIEVDAPINDHVITTTSWNDVLSTFKSWREVQNTFDTWLGVLEDPTA